MHNYKYTISEEITRWAFEVFVVRNYGKYQWSIAFTNPTAGPWKKIVALDSKGAPIEVYRFPREEDRPDLVLINDAQKRMLIIEAKDHAAKLQAPDQMKKTIGVINMMSATLHEISSDVWTSRKNYEIIPGFLWHSADFNSAKTENILINDVYVDTQTDLSSVGFKDPFSIVLFKAGDDLVPYFFYKDKSSKDFDLIKG